jgi:hypothetical protein
LGRLGKDDMRQLRQFAFFRKATLRVPATDLQFDSDLTASNAFCERFCVRAALIAEVRGSLSGDSRSDAFAPSFS